MSGSAGRMGAGQASLSMGSPAATSSPPSSWASTMPPGPGQALDEDTRAAIQSVQKPIKLEILVSLSCTMCPELVTAAQRIAAENPHITAQVYDLNHFPDLRERYQVMSVPCLVINDGAQVSFGKKNIRQLLELLT